MTTQLQPTTLRGLPSLSILHKPTHSPSFLLSSTYGRGHRDGYILTLHTFKQQFRHFNSHIRLMGANKLAISKRTHFTKRSKSKRVLAPSVLWPQLRFLMSNKKKLDQHFLKENTSDACHKNRLQLIATVIRMFWVVQFKCA